MILVTRSPFSRIVFLLKVKKSLRGMVLTFSVQAISTDAFIASSTGAVSQQEAAVQILPPIVPVFLTCSEPILDVASARAGTYFATSGESMTSPCVEQAPMQRFCSSSVMRFSSGILVREMMSWCMRNPFFISTSRSVPPAIAAVLGC